MSDFDATRFLAVDWGSTNRRVYLVEEGQVVEETADAKGVTAIPPGGFEAEIAAIRNGFGDLPMLLGGMVGSDIGWRPTAYVRCPAGLDALAGALNRIDDRTAIVPGVASGPGERPDVMRGEEVQLLGAAAAGLVPTAALLCQPGTHSKWAELQDGQISRFSTAMTGEIFALLKSRSLLADWLEGDVSPCSAFRDGLAEGGRRSLTTSLFTIRAEGLLGLRAKGETAAYASGLLIGAEVAEQLADSGWDAVHILAGPHLGPLYAAAVIAQGRTANIVDSRTAFIAGAVELMEFHRGQRRQL